MLGSRGSRASGTSRRSGTRSFRLPDPIPGNKSDSQSSEIDVPLPTHAAAGHEGNHAELEMGNLQNARGFMVSTSFDASDHAV